ncbi:uncharacterized protein LOC106873574 [Octopus bimaculoides]|uniref:GPR158/179 extracellular domain-containing protein n=1 Tax=Octopus bimaculoides TaxID=37653 RepID=A0A0L8H0V5_OCTBM|nr:uncharacterized protein LOC106873574 [Octopus bimaculoides]|eukprot:XP_014776491.1 PREDICTED: uncharacterized protein LOC106873574 [Octopus bimaculoides]
MKRRPNCIGFPSSVIVIFVCILVFSFTWSDSTSNGKPFELSPKDKFDEIMDKFTSVTGENCRSKHYTDLRLDNDRKKGVISQVPRYNTFLSTVYYTNRSSLLHAHNLALNRAFYYSYIYQELNKSEALGRQPGFEYIYFSLAADVSAGISMINGSGLFFDNNCSYPNWYTTLKINGTLPLFGPKAWRVDDYNEPTNWLREPTNNTIDIHDFGAGRSHNYTNPAYKHSPWYSKWLPDLDSNSDTLRKYTYNVGIRRSEKTGEFLTDTFQVSSFFGPPQPGSQEMAILPVTFTDPYFDCGRSNKWIVSATSPVVEFMPRYSNFTHLRRPQFVAVTTIDLEFERIDFNPCPISEGNPPPNYFANTARCKPTTLCEPLSGFGFRRGGYMCACLPGYKYPWWHDGPFLGVEIEAATKEEYENGFDCLKVDFSQVIPKKNPVIIENVKKRSISSFSSEKDEFLKIIFPQSHRSLRWLQSNKKYTSKDFIPLLSSRYRRHVPKEDLLSRKKRDLFDNVMWMRMRDILERKENTNKDNCASLTANQLLLPGDAGFGAEKQFESQGRTALRLAHFISNFLQNVDEYEEFGILRGDRRLHDTQMYGEVIATVMGDFKIVGAGVFFDQYKYRISPRNNTDPRYVNEVTREYFGPFAWKTGDKTIARVIDFAGFKERYTNKRWFTDMKSRWATNYQSLEKFITRPMIRSDINGSSLIRFEYYPLTYHAPKYEDGEWLRPVFKCDGRVDAWVLTYVVPFFGMNTLKTQIEFKGVVTVDVDINYLDVDQCPADFYVANAFKNTARCDYESTYCIPLQSHLKFKEGSYKCECKQGYEYPFNDLQWYYNGQTMVEEYRKKMNNEPNRYDTLKCRIGGASSFRISWILVILTILYIKMFQL